MDEYQQDQLAKLLAEQFGRFRDQMNARMERIEASAAHHSELEQERTAALRRENERLQRIVDDHEERLRTVTDGVTTFKTWSGLASGGSSVLSIVALVKAFLGL
jgi:hypothetical protein